jgi:predicted ATPase
MFGSICETRRRPNLKRSSAKWKQVLASIQEEEQVERFVLISGCSGGGKSTLLAELARRGHAVVEEPGRRIVRAELAQGGTALPWLDAAAFARRAVALAHADRAEAARLDGLVFFDRGLIDAAAALAHLAGADALSAMRTAHRYHRRVFMAPPWRAIYVADPERRHGFNEAVAEYERLVAVYPTLGYEVVTLPKIAVAPRADFVMRTLQA